MLSPPAPEALIEFHDVKVFIDGAALASAERLHDELTLKLGFPEGYRRTWDAFLACLFSIGDPAANLCTHWEFSPGERLILQLQNFSPVTTDPALLLEFANTIATANVLLQDQDHGICIHLEFLAGV